MLFDRVMLELILSHIYVVMKKKRNFKELIFFEKCRIFDAIAIFVET